MPIPTAQDHALAAISELADVVLLKLKVWHRAGRDRDPRAIREALRAYCDAVQDFVEGDAA
jgi:hypothetical protein